MRFTSFGANRTEGITAHALPPLKQFLERFQDARVNASRKNLEPFQTAQFQMEPFHFLSCKQGLNIFGRPRELPLGWLVCCFLFGIRVSCDLCQ